MSADTERPIQAEEAPGSETEAASLSTETSEETAKPDEPALAEVADQQPAARTPAEVASSILKWAKDHRLFARIPVDEAVDLPSEEASAENLPPQAAMMFASAQVEAVLRKRAINMIVFNDRQNKVIVYTKATVTAADHKIVPFADHGVTIEYSVGGVPVVKGNLPQPHGNDPFAFHNGRYCCGSSIFPGNCIGAGTLGFLAVDQSGKLFGVTNNHVTGACNHAAPGLPIMAPGPLDVAEDSIEPFCIGRHSRLIAINDGIPENVDISENLDACCFEIVPDAPVTSMQGNICDTPNKVSDPVPGTIVEKVGRTTGHTRGRITGQSIAPLAVSYAVNEYRVSKTVYFKNVFVVEGLAGDFSLRGDSGSLVMSVAPDGTRESIGVVFAGDERKKLSYILPLSDFLRKLNLEICSGYFV